jgi:hypothetical protein
LERLCWVSALVESQLPDRNYVAWVDPPVAEKPNHQSCGLLPKQKLILAPKHMIVKAEHSSGRHFSRYCFEVK